MPDLVMNALAESWQVKVLLRPIVKQIDTFVFLLYNTYNK
jgi:hypothetical protein